MFVVAYYIILEKYDYQELNTDGFVTYFIELVVFWHFFSRVMRTGFECGKKEYCSPIPFVIL